MKPSKQFLNQSPAFWANVRAISETLGYTERGTKTIKVPTLGQIARAMKKRRLDTCHLIATNSKPTLLGKVLLDYFQYRATVLNKHVEPSLMNAKQAKTAFQKLKHDLKPTPNCPLPMNKQKGSKRTNAYLTGMVNMLIEANSKKTGCDYDPRTLTTVTKNGKPVQTLSRRVDGAFPSTVNPVAVWEIKEYYYTTTFGSRVADAVYETLLDGMELAELKERENIHVLHYLIVDAHYTWWECGRSYLCRIIDALHMGYLDEVLFGSEVIERLPVLVRQWNRISKNKQS